MEAETHPLQPLSDSLSECTEKLKALKNQLESDDCLFRISDATDVISVIDESKRDTCVLQLEKALELLEAVSKSIPTVINYEGAWRGGWENAFSLTGQGPGRPPEAVLQVNREACDMGLFGKKKVEAPQVQQAALTEPEGAYAEVRCLVCISLDAKRHSFESDGYVRFYQNEMGVFAPPIRGAARDAMFRSNKDVPILQMCFPYSEISRIFFPRNITARLELQDGRYAFFVLNGGSRESFTGQLSARGIPYEPPKK